MSLTGGLFLGLVLVVTVGVFAAVIVTWPSLSGAGPARLAARIGLLALVNVLVLLTAGTQINAHYLFFADWTDLGGALSGTTTQTSLDRGAKGQVASRHANGTAATAAAQLPRLRAASFSPDGVATFTVHGPTSGITAQVVVRLPPGYLSAANASTRYPVLEAFSGYPGSPKQWVNTMQLGKVLDQQASTGALVEPLVVSPQAEVPAGVDTECVNGTPGKPQVEQWLTVDVPNWVTRTFRVKTDRASWATIGLSAGGWCAAMATILHPAQYGAAIVLGGYFRPELGPFYDPYPPRSALARRYDLVKAVKQSPPPVSIWLETSKVDATSGTSSMAFLAAAKPPLAVHAVVLQHAGHRIALWQGLLPGALQWLGSSLPGFG